MTDPGPEELTSRRQEKKKKSADTAISLLSSRACTPPEEPACQTHSPSLHSRQIRVRVGSENASHDYRPLFSFSSASAMPSSTLEHHDNNMQRKPQTIVICFDGASKCTAANSNTLKLYNLLQKDRRRNNDDDDQVVCHYLCEGTDIQWGLCEPIFDWVNPLLDRAFGFYLSTHILEGYKFLLKWYDDNDTICIFGSSHGAHIARALASMVQKVGLLPKGSTEAEIGRAYNIYLSADVAHARAFKRMASRNAIINFVGVWDTVATVGLVMPRTLPLLEPNTNIRVFRQALSLDEHRARFRPRLYNTTTSMKTSLTKPGIEGFETDVKEVWFAGDHSDIAGGATPDRAKNSLSNISLRWMIEQIVESKCNIIFDFDAFDYWRIPRSIGKSATGNSATSDELDKEDALQSMGNQLWGSPLWWPLELVPLSRVYQDEKGKWVTSWWPNLGRRRSIPPDPLFHTSVKMRMENLQYQPSAYYKGTERYVS